MSSFRAICEDRGKFLGRAVLSALIVCAVISAGAGLSNALHHSQDFQWSGARVLLDRTDPWAEYLRGDPAHRFVLCQVPNYLAILYILLAPLALLPIFSANLAWALINIVFAVVSAVLAGRFFGLSRRGLLVMACLTLMATPTRNAIGNGQQSLLVLFFWCLALLAPAVTPARSLLAGISYLKFTFAPPMAMLLLLRAGLKGVLLSTLPACAAVVLAWLWLFGGRHPEALLRLFKEPFLVAQHGFSPGTDDPNLINLVEQLSRGRTGSLLYGLAVCGGLAVCAAILHAASRHAWSEAGQWQVALLATLDFSMLPHHSYDGVVLIFPFCYALRRWRRTQARVVLLLLGYLFYLQRALEALRWRPTLFGIPGFLVLIVILICTFRLGRSEQREILALRQTASAHSREVVAA